MVVQNSSYHIFLVTTICSCNLAACYLLATIACSTTFSECNFLSHSDNCRCYFLSWFAKARLERVTSYKFAEEGNRTKTQALISVIHITNANNRLKILASIPFW